MFQAVIIADFGTFLQISVDEDYSCPSCVFIHAVTDSPVLRLKALLKVL